MPDGILRKKYSPYMISSDWWHTPLWLYILDFPVKLLKIYHFHIPREQQMCLLIK